MSDGATFETMVRHGSLEAQSVHVGGRTTHVRRILTAAGVPEILVTSQADRTLIEEKTEQVERLKAHVTELERLARQNRKHVSQRLKRYDQNFRALIEAKDAEIADLRSIRDYVKERDERIERLEAEKATMVPAFQLAEGVLKQAALRATLERVGERLAFTTDWGSLAEIQRWITDALDAVALSEPTEAGVLAEDLARVHSLAKPDWATERPCRLADCRIVGEHWHDGYRYWGYWVDLRIRTEPYTPSPPRSAGLCPSCLVHLERSGKGFD